MAAAALAPGPVWLITGAQASGKSTVADLLAREFDRGVHIRGGQFYRWAVRGWVHFDGEPNDEGRRLLDLRYRLSATVADEYARAGFTTVVQVTARDAGRTAATGKVAYRDGYTPAINDEHVASTPRDLGLWLDTSELTPDETVAEILRRHSHSIVPGGFDVTS